jgi:hypothetical protein
VFPVRYGQTYRIRDRTMDNVHICDSYINIPSSHGNRVSICISEIYGKEENV